MIAMLQVGWESPYYEVFQRDTLVKTGLKLNNTWQKFKREEILHAGTWTEQTLPPLALRGLRTSCLSSPAACTGQNQWNPNRPKPCTK